MGQMTTLTPRSSLDRKPTHSRKAASSQSVIESSISCEGWVMGQQSRWLELAVVAAALASCSTPPPPSLAPSIRSEHHFTASVHPATIELMGDCATSGDASCKSGVCLHSTQPRPQSQEYFCSQKCESQADCPEQWACSQVFATPGGGLCTPHMVPHPAAAQ